MSTKPKKTDDDSGAVEEPYECVSLRAIATSSVLGLVGAIWRGFVAWGDGRVENWRENERARLAKVEYDKYCHCPSCKGEKLDNTWMWN